MKNPNKRLGQKELADLRIAKTVFENLLLHCNVDSSNFKELLDLILKMLEHQTANGKPFVDLFDSDARLRTWVKFGDQDDQQFGILCAVNHNCRECRIVIYDPKLNQFSLFDKAIKATEEEIKSLPDQWKKDRHTLIYKS
jgi:hypothetical protein